MPLPYTARVLDDATLLSLTPADYEHLLATSLPIARRWLSSVAQRLAASQMRLLGLLGRTLTEQIAGLLLDESVDSQVPLPQRTLAAMLGAQRPQDPQGTRTRRTHRRALRRHRHPRPGRLAKRTG
jgi:CRP-like cAMP-binding protein